MRSYQRKRTSRQGYTGILATPLPGYDEFSGGLLASGTLEEMTKEARRKQTEDLMARTLALFEHYGIDFFDDDSWLKLTLALARRYVFGFQPAPPKTGRPKKWDSDRLLKLHVDYRSRREGGDTHKEAVAALNRQPAYRMETPGTLDRRVKGGLAEHPWLKHLVRSAQAEGYDMDEWSRFVLGVGDGSPNRRRRAKKGEN